MTTILTNNFPNYIYLYLYFKLSEDEYIPGGFANLDHELEEELLNDFADEFDEQTTRSNRYISSVHSSDHIINITRSPIELWQRARILIAIHLYQVFLYDFIRIFVLMY
jgi:hypothetical protein